MFVVESWPEAPSLPGLRVQTSADPAVLAAVFQPELDAVIWGRQVPAQWMTEMQLLTEAPQSVCIEGTLEEVQRGLLRRQGEAGWLPFILEDIAQNAAMASAFGVSVHQRLRVVPVMDEESSFVVSVGACCLLCCYGAGKVEWISGQVPGECLVSSTESFAIILTGGGGPMMADTILRYRFQKDGPTPALALAIEVF